MDKKTVPLRSKQWFDNPENPGMTALYLERYLNYGLTREELQSGKPIIGIAQTGSDLVRLVLIALALMGAGLALVRMGRASPTRRS